MVDLTKSFINHIVEISLLAGKIILEEYQKPRTKILVKEDSSPVTEADLKANEIIVERLLKLDKTIPCLSEESNENNNVFNEEVFWAVDPLDGTKEFINKTGDFTVNIGLIKNKKPVFGIVYAPILDKIWLGYIDHGNKSKESFRYENVTKSIDPLCYPKKNFVSFPHSEVILLTSRAHCSDETKTWANKNFGNKKTKIIQRGSSIKICLIAEGSAHVYPRFGRTCIWDTAAGHAVLTSSGGFITEIDKSIELIYSGKVYNPPFLASSYDLSALT